MNYHFHYLSFYNQIHTEFLGMRYLEGTDTSLVVSSEMFWPILVQKQNTQGKVKFDKSM